MSHDIKGQKNRPELKDGAALSTLLFVDEEADAPAKSSDQPPSASNANDAD